MRRIIMLVTVALVMAAMTVATAMPAFAKVNCDESSTTFECTGGAGGGQGTGGGGSGGHATYNLVTGESTTSSGGGAGGRDSSGSGGGGSGGHCSGDPFTGTECHGGGTYF
jgi:hypothetical protein